MGNDITMDDSVDDKADDLNKSPPFEDPINVTQLDAESIKPMKKKGRPKSAKNLENRRRMSKAKKLKLTTEGAPERLPKMKPNVHNYKLSSDQVDELKRDKKTFNQPGVCFTIAPHLDKCLECVKKSDRRFRKIGEVDCRFYQLRKLRYNGDELEVAGFLDPSADPGDIDRNVWLPQHEIRQRFRLSIQNARLILSHVGGEFCQLMKNEKSYYEKFNNPDKPIIWKRLIDHVSEICDICSTTLFNYHFICSSCGMTACVDCVNEHIANKEIFEVNCSKKYRDGDRDKSGHYVEDLSLTQIIVADCMDKVHKTFHEICHLWKIDHQCEMMNIQLNVDKATKNIIRNYILEVETGKTIFTSELSNKMKVIETDLHKIQLKDSLDVVEPELDDSAVDEYLKKCRKAPGKIQHVLPVKHYTSVGKENVISISRSMSQATSEMFYKAPHRWLCENKLLHLLDPAHPENEIFFHDQWQRGQPVLISNVLNQLQRELWIPQSFSAEFGHERSDFINCMNGNLVRNREISTFWDGFEVIEKRLKDNEGIPMLLKLKDWPPDSDFKNVMPSRFEDIMKNLPMNAYTNRTGDLNIVKYLPVCFLHPDLGPKGYFAYGSPFHLKEGTTNLHLDIADACNVMCYVGFPRDKKKTMDEYIEQGFKALIEADCDITNINRVIKNGEIPGAIWHIYEACDADRIRDFLLKIAQEKGFKVANNHDVIHDQNWYLDGELRSRLYREYGVKGYAIVQCLGDCIILPAGTPHQVRNIYNCIKIAEDFVSPQQVAHCLHLSNEFRKLTKVR